MCQCPGPTYSAYIQCKQQLDSWEARLPSDTLSISSAHGPKTLRSTGRDHLPSLSVQPAHKGKALPQRAALPWRQKPSALGKLDFIFLCVGICFRKLHIPKQHFRIYPNCSARCRTEPKRYICLWWSKAFLSPLSCYFRNTFLKALESIFLFLLMIYISEAAHEKMCWPFS